jgi:predicted methyltransferase
MRQFCLVPLTFLLSLSCTLAGVADEGAGIVSALALAPGMTVADVGAGNGGFSVVLAHSVGARGRVYATEVDRGDIDRIADRARGEKLENVTTVLGTQTDTGLPAGCCDAILLRLVYHHFTDAGAMRRSLWDALKAGGRLAVIDVPPQKGWRQLDGVPDRGGHGVPIAEVIRDMTRAGFEIVMRDEDWPAEDDAYLVVFRRP